MQRWRIRWGGLFLAFLLGAGCGRPGERDRRAGLRELDRGRNVRALAAFERAVDRHPEGVEGALAWNGIGIACARLGETERAIEAFETSHWLYPDAGAPLYNLGVLLGREGNSNEAAALLLKAAVHRPHDPAPLEYLGHLYLARGLNEAAQERLLQALEEQPDSPSILTALGVAEWRIHGPGPAEALFRTALENDPRYAPALYNLFLLWDRAMNQPTRAAEFGRRFVASGDSPERLASVRVWLDALETGASAPASPFLPSDEGVPKPPASASTAYAQWMAEARARAGQGGAAAEPALHAAEAAHQAGDPVGRERAYRFALDQAFDHADVQVAWGMYQLEMGRRREAAAAFGRALALKEGHAGAQHGLARVAAESKEHDVAPGVRPTPEPEPEPVAPPSLPERVGPTPPERPGDVPLPAWPSTAPPDPVGARAAHRQGVEYQHQRRYELAEQQYLRALELDEGGTVSLYNLATLHQKQGDADRARSAYYAVLEREPNHAAARYNLAVLYQDLGELERAMAHVRFLLSIRPEHAPSWYLAGILYSDRAGGADEARRHFERFLELAPEDPLAEPVRRWMESR